MAFRGLLNEARKLLEADDEKQAAMRKYAPDIMAASKKGFANVLSRGGQVTRSGGISKVMRSYALKKRAAPPPIPRQAMRSPGKPPPPPPQAFRPTKPKIEDVLLAYKQLMQENDKSLQKFASEVNGIVHRSGTDHGPTGKKMFIHHIHQRIGFMPKAKFHDNLIKAHKAGLIKMQRQDLMRDQDPETIRKSEVKHGMATYHKIGVG